MSADERDAAHEAGRASAFRELLAVAVRGLGRSDIPDDLDALKRRVGVLEGERSAAVAALRRVCAEHGSNEWPDSLYLADVVEKHLGRVLDDERDGARSDR